MSFFLLHPMVVTLAAEERQLVSYLEIRLWVKMDALSSILSAFDDILKHLAPDFGIASAMSGTVCDDAVAVECDLCG